MTLVANRGGRRKILWGPVFKVALSVVPLSTGATSLAYYLLTDRWNPLAAWLGLGAGFLIVIIILLASMFTPVNRLPLVR